MSSTSSTKSYAKVSKLDILALKITIFHKNDILRTGYYQTKSAHKTQTTRSWAKNLIYLESAEQIQQ